MIIRLFLIAFLIFSFNAKGQWFEQNISTTSSLSGLQFIDSTTGFVQAQNVSSISFYKTTTSGNSWTHIYDAMGPMISSMFLSSGKGFVTYQHYPSGVDIARTTDGGITFSPPQYFGFNFLNSLHFFNDSVGISAGAYGAPQIGTVYKTIDGGDNWQVIYQSVPIFTCCSFIDNLTGWAAGFSMPGSAILKTTDGGYSWNPFNSGNLYQITKIKFFNDNNGWVLSSGTLYRYSGGSLFETASSVNSFFFFDMYNGWYVSQDKIYYTNNGGYNWSIQYSNPGKTLNDITFTDAHNGWACGSDGLLLRTMNGGTPVDLVSFTAENVKDTVNLSWMTSTETNNRGFYIERRSSTEQWQNIGFVEGSGTTTEERSYTFKDRNVPKGKYQYRLKQTDLDGSYEYSSIVEVKVEILKEYRLEQNYPNPFNPSTRIKYSIAEEGLVNLSIYNLLGQKVAELRNEVLQPGYYETEFDASLLSSGIYVYKMSAGGSVISKKMVYLK